MIINRQRGIRISVGRCEKFLSRARRTLGLSPRSLTICFVTDRQMARWNRTYRGKAYPTDVLSFPAEKKNGLRRTARGRFAGSLERPIYLGDIAISPAVAKRNARKFGRTLEEEIHVLVLHGILHLMGYDHESDTGQMDRRERRLRRDLGLA